MDPAHMVRAWADSVFRSIIVEAKLTQGSLLTDADGRPYWIPIFLKEGDLKKPGKKERPTKPDSSKKIGMSDSDVWDMIDHLVVAMNWHLALTNKGTFKSVGAPKKGNPRTILTGLVHS